MIHVVGRLVQKMKIVVDKPAKKPSGVNGMAPNENKAIKREYYITYFGSGCDDGKAREPMPPTFLSQLFFIINILTNLQISKSKIFA